MTNKKDKTMLQLYSIRNIKEKLYGNPMCMPNPNHAMQSVATFFNNNKELNPENFELHHIGNFSEKTGTLSTDKKTLIANCSNVTLKTETDLQTEIEERTIKTKKFIKETQTQDKN